MNYRYHWAAFTAVLLAGCATESTPTPRYPPTDPANVMLLKKVPKHPFEELGRVSAAGTYYPPEANASKMNIIGDSSIYGILQTKAAALGADAVILKEETILDPMEVGGTSNVDTSSRQVMATGIAIKFITSAQVPPPPSPIPATP